MTNANDLKAARRHLWGLVEDEKLGIEVDPKKLDAAYERVRKLVNQEVS